MTQERIQLTAEATLQPETAEHTHTHLQGHTHSYIHITHTPTLPYSIKKSMSKYAKFTKQGHVGLGGLEWQVQVHENGIDAWLAWHMQLLAQPSQAQFQTELPPDSSPDLDPDPLQCSRDQLVSSCESRDCLAQLSALQFKGDGTKLWSALFASGEWGLWTKNSCWLVWRPQRGFKLSHNSILTTLRIRNTVGDQ